MDQSTSSFHRTSQKRAGQVWVKPLVGGRRAVALLNRAISADRLRAALGAGTADAEIMVVPP